MLFFAASEVSSPTEKEKDMRKLELLVAAAAIAVATPMMAQGPGRVYAFVPVGMMPPAGMCRIWIDGVPPGRQPAPTSCAVAARWMPAHAQLIYGPTVYVNPNYNDRLYQEQLLRERELQIAREREFQIAQERDLQIARERELQIAREREFQINRDRELQIARDREAAAVRAHELDAQRGRAQAAHEHEAHDRALDHHDNRDFGRGDRR
jgi:hypothetical protein